MRTVTIAELHRHTGRLVRASIDEKIVITDHGRAVALLKRLDAPDLVGKPFPKRDIRKMPKSDIDSTIIISRDRDGR